MFTHRIVRLNPGHKRNWRTCTDANAWAIASSPGLLINSVEVVCLHTGQNAVPLILDTARLMQMLQKLWEQPVSVYTYNPAILRSYGMSK
jgi:hypothetical protein